MRFCLFLKSYDFVFARSRSIENLVINLDGRSSNVAFVTDKLSDLPYIDS